LNFNRREQALTQGQSQGQMVVARAVQIDEITAQSEAPASSRGAAPQTAGPANPAVVDARAVAQRVYELMRQDLRVTLERRKPGG
jgi:hypothetical protein